MSVYASSHIVRVCISYEYIYMAGDSILTQTPSEPPLSVGPLSDLWSFVGENELWPLVHTVTPFTAYMYLRNWKLVIFLVFLNEVVEALLTAITGGSDLFTELPTNSLISDPLMGAIGLTLAEFLMRVLDRHRHTIILPIQTIRFTNLDVFFKYLLQIILLFLPLIFVRTLYADHVLSIGLTVFIIYYPLLVYYGYRWWNAYELLWVRCQSPIIDISLGNTPIQWYTMKHVRRLPAHQHRHANNTTDAIDDHVLQTYTTHTAAEKQNCNQARNRRFYGGWALFVFLYAGSFFYRWTSVFLMSLVHSAVALFILNVI